MSRITAARRSKSFAPAHLSALIKKERPSWTARYAPPREDEENHSVDHTTNKHRKMGNRATDLARLRDESTDLQARIERFKVVAHEAAAKAHMINSGALTLRAHHPSSISAITRPPPRHRACWPSSVSYRCAASTSAQRARRQLSPVVAPPASPTPSPHPASLTKTGRQESKHTLSLGDFLATIPGEHRANTLRKRKVAPPTSPPARGEEEASVAKEEAEAILSSPMLKRRLQDALLAEIEADRETTSVTISITISSTSAAVETDSSGLEETSIAANEGGEEEEVVVAAVEEVVVLERNTRAHKSVDRHVDEGMLKRKDIVVRKKKKKNDVRDDDEEEGGEDEAKRKGKKRKTASSFLASIINPKKKMKKSKLARKERESVADAAKENEKKANMAAAVIEQEKHDQRVAYIKRKIEERYGVVRREAKRSGKRVRIQEPNAAAAAVPQPPPSEGKQTGEAKEKVVCNETTTTAEGGRRRRAVTVEEVTSEMASAIAGARQPLIKQRGVILLDKENLGNVGDVGETKKPTGTKNSTKTDTDDTKKRKSKKATHNISSSSASLTLSSAASPSSGPAILVSSAAGHGVYVPRRPLQPRN